MLHQPVSPLTTHLPLHPSHPHTAPASEELSDFLLSLSSSPIGPHQGPGAAFDNLLLAAATAQAPGMTRHHLQHSSWLGNGGKSFQMPRSERLRMAARVGTGAVTPPSDQEGEKEEPDKQEEEVQEKEEKDEKVGEDAAHGPLSGLRARTPPTPPQAPEAKRARAATGVRAPELREALEALPAATSASTPPRITSLRNAVAEKAPAAAASTGLSVQTEEEVQVKCMARTRIPTAYGPVFLHVYHNNQDGKEHLAIVSDPMQLESSADGVEDYVPIRSHTLDVQWREGETARERITRGAYVSRLSGSSAERAPVPTQPRKLDDAPLVRIHSECFTGETIGSLRCDCGEQLDSALSLIAHAPGRRGVVLYLRQEGRGIGLLEKVRAYNLQDLGLDTVQANLALGRGEDERTYGVAAAMLRDLGVAGEGIRLLTNNPNKVDAMQQEGISVQERVPMVPRDWQARDALSHPQPHSRSHPHAGDLLPTAPHTPNPDSPINAWDTRTKGATIVGGGVVRSEELEKYLRTKVMRMGHLLDLPTVPSAARENGA
ncbi:hypothetical protein DACRYDRAFT_113247 [Dacryopinax primogenitus]|uniref:GTP cyclohydrolase II n=1 Tax=Dacryopinax primogenitus (strain DJM 731) TaxID=1858805 RepID=M5GH41_DACPD|nr:uncharacterized protein DACRYDRAFT_113247 [Dacryopinax primogenitus]EJU06578.1 hypothetical protein DACRYDRAFT_113247 [Dacryopinax primogenitus]